MSVEMIGIAVIAIVTGISLVCLYVMKKEWFIGPSFSLRDQVVLITGAANGVGKELSLQLSQKAFAVKCLILLDVEFDALLEVKKTIEALNEEIDVRAYYADVADYGSLIEQCGQIKKEIFPSQINVIVNNAGIVRGLPFFKLSSSQFSDTLNINTVGQFNVIKCFIDEMMAHKDQEFMIVSVSSLMGLMCGANLIDYCASKHAVEGMHESLRLDLLRYGIKNIHTLIIKPYAIQTEMFRGIYEGENQSWIATTFFPKLKVSPTVVRIIKAIQYKEYDVTIPSILTFAPYVAHLLPIDMYHQLLQLFGATTGMDNFIGRTSSEKK